MNTATILLLKNSAAGHTARQHCFRVTSHEARPSLNHHNSELLKNHRTVLRQIYILHFFSLPLSRSSANK